MNENYAKQGKFFPDSEGVRSAAESVSHGDLSKFFAKYVAGLDEIPWDDFFKAVGLRVVARRSTVAERASSRLIILMPRPPCSAYMGEARQNAPA